MPIGHKLRNYRQRQNQKLQRKQQNRIKRNIKNLSQSELKQIRNSMQKFYE